MSDRKWTLAEIEDVFAHCGMGSEEFDCAVEELISLPEPEVMPFGGCVPPPSGVDFRFPAESPASPNESDDAWTLASFLERARAGFNGMFGCPGRTPEEDCYQWLEAEVIAARAQMALNSLLETRESPATPGVSELKEAIETIDDLCLFQASRHPGGVAPVPGLVKTMAWLRNLAGESPANPSESEIRKMLLTLADSVQRYAEAGCIEAFSAESGSLSDVLDDARECLSAHLALPLTAESVGPSIWERRAFVELEEKQGLIKRVSELELECAKWKWDYDNICHVADKHEQRIIELEEKSATDREVLQFRNAVLADYSKQLEGLKALLAKGQKD